MNRLLLALTLVGNCIIALAQTANYNVVPMPESIIYLAAEEFILTDKQCISYPEGDELMERNARFLQEYVKETTGIELRLTTNTKNAVIRLTLDPKNKDKEGYSLLVNKKGITIKGLTSGGVFYGIQTLRKSLPVEKVSQVTFPAVEISDAPRFAYRGMMLDCGRHFFSTDFVKEFIDLIAMHNMNRFHWHLSEDQGWRIEIKKYPLLTQIGSKRPGTIMGHISQLYDNIPVEGFYTQEECREIVEYARQRHIEVIPEIDMPGHQKAALAAYPELGCTGGPYSVGREWGVFLDILCMGNEKTYEFCEDVLTEIMDIFPSKIIHIGGDEAPKKRTAECPKCMAMIEREGLTLKTSQGYFTNRIEKFLNSKGRSIVGWDEILDGDINMSATIHAWHSDDRSLKAAQNGHDVIMSPTTYCYFDFQQVDPTKNQEPNQCHGLVTMQKLYNGAIVPNTLSEEAKAHILGIQANLWTEYVKYPNMAEYQILPRMAALCEQQWCKDKQTWEEFYPRVTRLTELYDLYNLHYARHIWPEKMPPAKPEW